MSGVAALVAAAGSGERLGLGPKAFVEVGGRTLLEWTALAFAGSVSELLVAVPRQQVDRARRLVPGANVTVGGTDRQSTVRLLVEAAQADVVLVHDVARPFLTEPVIERLLAAVNEGGAATAALAPADTVVEAATGEVLRREDLRLVQTPQAFRRELLREAHRAAAADFFKATDDAALVRRLGTRVALVQGSPLLAKLTRPEDLPLFGALHQVWLGETASGAAERA